jgi:hypothetical protein
LIRGYIEERTGKPWRPGGDEPAAASKRRGK